MESECSVCLRVSKYKCVKYNIPVCNVCSTTVSSKTEGYCVVIVKALHLLRMKLLLLSLQRKFKKTVGMQLSSPSPKIQPTKKTQSTIDLQSAGKTKESTITSMEI